MQLQSYIQNLPISNIFKELILDKQFLESNPIFYQNYPSLFSNAFSVSPNEIDYLILQDIYIIKPQYLQKI